MTITDVWLNPLSSSSSTVLGYREDSETFYHNIYSFFLSSIREEDTKYNRLLWRWLQGMQERWESIYGKILNLPTLLSPDDCPEEYLEYLKDIVGITDRYDYLWGELDDNQQRRMIKYFVNFIFYRYTTQGIIQMIENMTGYDAILRGYFYYRWLISGDYSYDMESSLGRENEEGSDPWLISEIIDISNVHPDNVGYIYLNGLVHYTFVINGFYEEISSESPPVPEKVRIIYTPTGVSTTGYITKRFYLGSDVYSVSPLGEDFGQKEGYVTLDTDPQNFVIRADSDPYVFDIILVDDGSLNRDLIQQIAKFSRANSEKIYIRYYFFIEEFDSFDQWTEVSGTATLDSDAGEVELYNASSNSIIRPTDTSYLSWTNYSVGVQGKIDSINLDAEIRFAWQDSNNYFYLRFYSNLLPTIPPGNAVLGEVVGGVDTPYQTVDLDYLDVDVNYFWRIVWVIIGTDVYFQVYQDENLIIDRSESDPFSTAEGTIELYSEVGNTFTVKYVEVFPFPMDYDYIGP